MLRVGRPQLGNQSHGRFSGLGLIIPRPGLCRIRQQTLRCRLPLRVLVGGRVGWLESWVHGYRHLSAGSPIKYPGIYGKDFDSAPGDIQYAMKSRGIRRRAMRPKWTQYGKCLVGRTQVRLPQHHRPANPDRVDPSTMSRPCGPAQIAQEIPPMILLRPIRCRVQVLSRRQRSKSSKTPASLPGATGKPRLRLPFPSRFAGSQPRAKPQQSGPPATSRHREVLATLPRTSRVGLVAT